MSYDCKFEKRCDKNGVEFNNEVLRFISANPSEIAEIFSDSINADNITIGGSNSMQVRVLNRQGKYIRDGIKSKLASIEMYGPQCNWFRSELRRI